MCQCYQLGGPFIAEDPECPEHGREAQDRERRRQEANIDDWWESLPEGRQKVLLEDRWMLARAAFEASKNV